MNNQGKWREFVRDKKSVLLLFAFAMVSSTLYAIYLKKTGDLNSAYIENYLQDTDGVMERDFMSYVRIFCNYYSRYLIAWGMGMVTFFSPLALCFIFGELFSYGFSLTMMYLNYGWNGLFLVAHLFMVQGVLFLVQLLVLGDWIIKKAQMYQDIKKQQYGMLLIYGGVGCGVIAAIEYLLVRV